MASLEISFPKAGIATAAPATQLILVRFVGVKLRYVRVSYQFVTVTGTRDIPLLIARVSFVCNAHGLTDQ